MASSKRGFHLREAFQRFDKDGDGSVSHDELKVVINDILQGDITEEEMVAVIELFDPDGDGDIKYAEFRDLFYSISVDEEKERDMCDLRGKDIDDNYIEAQLVPHLMRDEYSHLLLSNNRIGDDGAEEIAMGLADDKAHVSVIDLRHNQIGEKGAEHLGESLGNNVYILELYLSYNQILGRGAARLCHSLEPTNAGFSAISILDLRHCGIDDEGGVKVGLSFRGNTALRNIGLSGNYLGDKTAAAIASALQNERCMIQSLNLSNNEIGGEGGKMIGHAIRTNVELKELILSGNPLGDLGISSFAESLEGVEAPDGIEEKKDAYEDSGKSKEERKDDVNQNKEKLTQSGTAAFCGLRVLGMSGCSITDNGLADLGGSLRTNAVLRTIDVRCNKLTDVGITSLARSMEENTCLRELYCGNNDFGAPSATALGSALEKNCALLVLDVSGCNLAKGNAAKMLADGLIKNECLHELSISRTHLSDDGVKDFIMAIEQNMCLEKIIFHNNPITKSTIAALNFAMTRERKPAAKLLDIMESKRLKHKEEVKKREVQRKIKAAAEAGEAGDDAMKAIAKKSQEVLEPGTKIWIPVSFGRRNNILGKIEVESHTTLADARIKIDMFGDLGDEYIFISINDGKPIEMEEEGKRQVTWDCGRHVLLRPVNWIDLD